jgi:hypothetical protein
MISAISFPVQLSIAGGFTFLMWLFVFRKYRSLGLRLFFVFGMVSLMFCFWFYSDLQEQKVMEQNGQIISAKLMNKWTERSGENSLINLLEVIIEYPKGQQKLLKTSKFISDEEHAALKIGQNIELLYNSNTQQAYYIISYQRYQKDKWIFYILPAFFLMLGAVLGYFLRNFKVGVHSKTGDEFIEKDGKILFDESGNELARTMKKANIISKFFQAFKSNLQ